jgi:hypothetical protein
MEDSFSRRITIADVAPTGIVLHFDNGISVYYSTNFLWQNRQEHGNKIIPDPKSDE